jgi:transketolase
VVAEDFVQERRLAKIQGLESTKATIRYPFDLLRGINAGWGGADVWSPKRNLDRGLYPAGPGKGRNMERYGAAETERLEVIANRLRIHVVKMIAASGVGHLGGAVSIAEILSVLYFKEMTLDANNPVWQERDRFVLSKGHGCPALYAVLAEAGILSTALLPTLHEIDSPLQMHPEVGLCPGIEMSTGALGQGLSAAIGMALGGKIRGLPSRIYVLIGDGECMEGQIWEAAMFAPKYKLDNLVGILDYNKFSLTDRIDKVMPLEPLQAKWAAFGWHVLEVDGHSVTQLIQALELARAHKGNPTMIIAHTVKGKGVSFVENRAESHSVSLTRTTLEQTLTALGCSAEEIEDAVLTMKEY